MVMQQQEFSTIQDRMRDTLMQDTTYDPLTQGKEGMNFDELKKAFVDFDPVKGAVKGETSFDQMDITGLAYGGMKASKDAQAAQAAQTQAAQSQQAQMSM